MENLLHQNKGGDQKRKRWDPANRKSNSGKFQHDGTLYVTQFYLLKYKSGHFSPLINTL